MTPGRDRDPEPPHLSFRTFVDYLRVDNDLIEVDEPVDPHLEAAAITRLVCETNDKAPLFNNVLGARNSFFRILGAPAALRRHKAERYGRLARHLGMPITTDAPTLIEKILSGYSKPLIEPITVETSPFKQNSIAGNDIGLTAIPATMIHETDGGKYIGTYGINILNAPDGNWANWSINRVMIVDKRTMTGTCYPPQHNWQIVNKWKEIGQDAPWAFVLGVPPAAAIVSAMPIPDGVTEASFIGALVDEPLKLVKCDSNNLLVPANAEIVFEGTISITEQVPEGPYSEMYGVNFPGESLMMPLFKVDSITYRNNPIAPLSATGRLTDETQSMAGLVAAAEVLRICRDANLPVLEASSPLVSQCTWAVLKIDRQRLIAMKTSLQAFSKLTGDVVFSAKAGVPFHRLLLVGEDIDIHDDADVMWAFSTRCRPHDDEYPFDDANGFSLIPYMAHGSNNPRIGGKLVCDCLFPVEYNMGRNWVNTSFVDGYPQPIQEKVLAHWEERGFRKL